MLTAARVPEDAVLSVTVDNLKAGCGGAHL